MKTIEEILITKGVKLTANRLLVAKCIEEEDHPVSLAEIEERISTMDKSSIFRTLTRFVEHDVVHVIDDGSGSLKYEMCHGENGHTMDDMHVHFGCELCGKIVCFKSSHVPQVQLPEGFQPLHVNYVIKGICDNCSKSSNYHS